MDQFLENYSLPKLTKEEKQIMNSPRTTKRIEAVVKTSYQTNKEQKMAGDKIFYLICGLQVGEEILILWALLVSTYDLRQ